MARQYKNHKRFVCYDCAFVFLTITKCKRTRPFCPNCGDNISVESYKAERVGSGKGRGLTWQSKELEYLEQYISGELEAHQVAILTARSIEGVYLKAYKIKKARGIV